MTMSKYDAYTTSSGTQSTVGTVEGTNGEVSISITPITTSFTIGFVISQGFTGGANNIYPRFTFSTYYGATSITPSFSSYSEAITGVSTSIYNVFSFKLGILPSYTSYASDFTIYSTSVTWQCIDRAAYASNTWMKGDTKSKSSKKAINTSVTALSSNPAVDAYLYDYFSGVAINILPLTYFYKHSFYVIVNKNPVRGDILNGSDYVTHNAKKDDFPYYYTSGTAGTYSTSGTPASHSGYYKAVKWSVTIKGKYWEKSDETYTKTFTYDL